MEKLFAIILLTLINVLEILLLLNTTMLAFELVVILLLLLLVFAMLFMLGQDYFWGMALFVFIINTINVAYLFLVFGGGFLIYMSIILVLFGLVYSMLNMAAKPRVRIRPVPVPEPKAVEIEKEIKVEEEKPRVIIEEYPVKKPPKKRIVKKKPKRKKVVKKKPKKRVKKRVKRKPKKKITRKRKRAKKKVVKKVNKRRKPGRYVASARAKTYHILKCEWADNIKRKNKIWFNSRKKAEALGLEPHTCLPGVSKPKKPKRKPKKKAIRKKPKKRVTRRVKKRKPMVVKQVKKIYKPGKYVASTQGKVYHIPKCVWANNIERKNRVWFNSKPKAEKLGYTKHSCVENKKPKKSRKAKSK